MPLLCPSLVKGKQQSLSELPGFSLQPWTWGTLDEGWGVCWQSNTVLSWQAESTSRHCFTLFQPRLVNGIALACAIALVRGVYVINTNSARLLRGGKIWLLLGCCSAVCLKYTESKSSKKPKCSFIEPAIERTETSETRSLWCTGACTILGVGLRYIQWHQHCFSSLHYPESWSTVTESRSCHKMSNLNMRLPSSETFLRVVTVKGFVLISASLWALYLCSLSVFPVMDLILFPLTWK